MQSGAQKETHHAASVASGAERRKSACSHSGSGYRVSYGQHGSIRKSPLGLLELPPRGGILCQTSYDLGQGRDHPFPVFTHGAPRKWDSRGRQQCSRGSRTSYLWRSQQMNATPPAEPAPTAKGDGGPLAHLFIADVDVHVHDDPGALAPYCDPPWDDALRELTHVHERYLDIPGFAIGWEGIDPPIPGRIPGVEDAGDHPDWETRVVRSADQLRSELSALHIDAAIVFPDNLLTLGALANPRYACALASAYNRWIEAEWLDVDRGLHAALVVAPHDPREGAAEIARWADRSGFAAIYLPTAAVNPPWGHAMYDPIYDAAQEAGLPVVFHSVGIIHPNFPHNVHAFSPAGVRHALLHPLGMITSLMSLIGSGVPARFPRLKVVFTEGGVSWVPFVAWRLDREYLERRREFPFYSEPPSHYVRQFFFSTQPIEEPEDPRLLVQLIEACPGADHILFASDWPHHDFDHPRVISRLPFTHEQKAAVLGETALELFRLRSGSGG